MSSVTKSANVMRCSRAAGASFSASTSRHCRTPSRYSVRVGCKLPPSRAKALHKNKSRYISSITSHIALSDPGIEHDITYSNSYTCVIGCLYYYVTCLRKFSSEQLAATFCSNANGVHRDVGAGACSLVYDPQLPGGGGAALPSDLCKWSHTGKHLACNAK